MLHLREKRGGTKDQSSLGSHVSKTRLAIRERAEKRKRTRNTHRKHRRDEGPWLMRVANNWWNRLISAVYSGSFSDETEQYAAHSTTRDYIWNTIGSSMWGFLFPALTIVATQLAGIEQAGMFSMAFALGQVLLWIASYGVRTYQVSDLDEGHSFRDYVICRVLTCTAMVIVSFLYCSIMRYTQPMLGICTGVLGFRAVDQLADVYEGRLQQMDKLYLAGISQTIRSVGAGVLFSIVLLITRSMPAACISMIVAAVISFVLVTLPLTLFETQPARKASIAEIRAIFEECSPLFGAMFLYALIDCVPKLVMQSVLSYDNQLYFNAMYFPTHSIIMVGSMLYKPQLVRLANIWSEPSKHRRFSLIVFALIGVVALVSVVVGIFMMWLGIPILGFMYGVDFQQFAFLILLMVLAGFLSAAVDFLYQIITVLRAQEGVVTIYFISFIIALVISLVLVSLFQLTGAVIASAVSMAVLFGLLLVKYFSIMKTARS